MSRAAGLQLLAAALLLAVASWAVLNRGQFDVATVAATIAGLGAWAPAAFVGAFTLGTVLFVPGAVFGLAGGALFGPLWGTLLNLGGATLGAIVAFLVARHIASDWVARRAGGRLAQLMAGVEAEGWRFVALMRLIPLVPFNLLNYALGLTRLRLLDYAAATLVCMLPGTIAYTYLGYAGREALAGGEALVQKGLIAIGLLALAAFLPRLVRRLRAPPETNAIAWIEVPDLAERLTRVPRPAVIDVRGPDEFTGELGHIPAALNLPMADLGMRLTEINAHKTGPVILVCQTDKRSAKAAAVLQTAGFRDVRVLRGGMEQWTRNGLPVEERRRGE